MARRPINVAAFAAGRAARYALVAGKDAAPEPDPDDMVPGPDAPEPPDDEGTDDEELG